MSRSLVILLMFTGSLPTNVRADVTSTFDYAQWQALVDDYSTINFTGFPNATPISNRFVDLGVSFTGPAFISGPTPGYANDGWGLHGPSGIHIFFREPQSWIAIDHAGTALFNLYRQGVLVGTSDFDPVGGIGSFLGVVSTEQFDEIFLTTTPFLNSHVFIDDLHWGAPIPSPGALTIFTVAVLLGRSRKRT